MVHSNETIVVLAALRRLHLEIEELRKEIADCKNTLERIEQTGVLEVGTDETESEDDAESSESRADSAPF